MHILYLNYVYDHSLRTTAELLDRYQTITGYCAGLRRAGAQHVTVVQRFAENASLENSGVVYKFINDSLPANLRWWQIPRAVNASVAALKPDVVHLNGMMFGTQLVNLRKVLPSQTAILIQDHTDGAPMPVYKRIPWSLCLRSADGFIVTAAEIAKQWHSTKFLPLKQPFYEIVEGSSNFALMPREKCAPARSLSGRPIFLWVGRLANDKDPLTVIKGFAEAARQLPQARLFMIYGTGELLSEAKELIHQLGLEERVQLLGKIDHAELEPLYNMADYFMLGSLREGSGYALLEALSCGVTPIVTDIPAFRRITDGGRIGALWQVGETASLAAAIRSAVRRSPRREKIREYFERSLSFDALGRAALDVYQTAYHLRKA